MEFTADTPFSRQIPDGYESLFRASYNYRTFILFLNKYDLEYAGNASVELLFPWQFPRDAKEDIDNHFHQLIGHALEVLHALNDKISESDSRVYLAEIDKTRCTFKIATSQPQALCNSINNFACPEVFNMPRLQTDKRNPSEIVQTLFA